MSAQHGNTVAAWAGVAIMMLGFVLGAIGMLVPSTSVFWSGVIVLFVGPVAGLVLQKLGFGQSR